LDFKLNTVRRENKGHFRLMKGTIHQGEISVLNLFTPNTGAPTYMKKKTVMALSAHIDTNTLIVGDLNTPLSRIDRSSREKMKKFCCYYIH
jgi:hypothetical protein